MDSEEIQEFIASASSANFCISERDSNVSAKIIGDSSRSNIPVPNELGITEAIEHKDKNQTLECIIEQFLELKKENDKLNKDLIGEKHRTQKYQKKLKYIQDNHVIFERLKQAYMNMKFTEASSRKSLIEVTEQSVQCEGDYIPRALHDQDANFERYTMVIANRNDGNEEIYVEPEFIAVRRAIFDGLKATVEEFKKMIISQPLNTFVLSENREAKYRKDIASLYLENQSLKQLAINKQIELDELKKNLEPRNSVFRKIIAKMAYKINKMNAPIPDNQDIDPSIELNEKELKVIEQILKKFDSKLKQKSICETCSSTDNSTLEIITTPKSTTPYFTPRTPTGNNLDSDRMYYTPRSSFENENEQNYIQ